MIEVSLRYLVLQCAIEQFQRAPEYLSQKQFKRVLKQARKVQKIEAALSCRCTDLIAYSSLQYAEQQLKRQFISEQDYRHALTWLHLEPELLKDSLMQSVQAERVLDKVRQSVSEPDDDELYQYYSEHQQQFIRPLQIRLRHLLRTINDDYPENSIEQLRPWMNELYFKLKCQTDRFVKMVERYSECPSVMQGGLLGNIAKGQLYPELEAVAFSLKAGELSRPVRSPMGFHLLFCDARYPEHISSFDSVRDELQKQLFNSRRRLAEQQLIQQML
ncbi:MAG: Chaperone SurA [Candidatus Celerinatantimonas neptuna]|nr:MAG: Chaperone SurA [Candidatus Celerinatantimonas neptuna]